jgi:hypothetical protein
MSQKPALVSLPNDDREAQPLRFLCEDTARRLNVVLRLVASHDCHDDDTAADGTGGFDLAVIQEELRRIREQLQEAL